MACCCLSITGCPLDSTLVPLADNHAIRAALADEQRDGLAIFVGHESDIVAFKHIINRDGRLIDLIELIE